jgi:hypothetical protein
VDAGGGEENCYLRGATPKIGRKRRRRRGGGE